MKKTRLLVLRLAVLAFAFSLQSPFVGNSQSVKKDAPKNGDFVAGELLVKFKDDAARQNLSSVHAEIGAAVMQDFAEIGWQQIRLPENLSVSEAIAHYKESADVAAVQPNFVYHLLAVPNDTRYSELYGMAKISAPTAWNTTTGSAAVVVADIDTGTRLTHEDLAANIWHNADEIAGNGIDDDANGFVDDVYGWDFFSNDANPFDENGHGTHTAGTIGAVGNNSKGVTGVNWNVRLMTIKIYDAAGDSSSTILINAYNYIRMMRTRGVNIRVTNNSYGGCNEACGFDAATKDALDALDRADVLQVFAAGNSNTNNDSTPFYPANYTTPSILAVAASDANDNRASFSSYGATTVDVAAPGVSILSTILGNNNTSYGFSSGTSMATPHTAGAAALLAAANPNLSTASLKATLMNTVDVLPQWNGVVLSGGRINVARAIQTQTVCTFNVAPVGSTTFTSSGGTRSFTVTAPTNCGYAGYANQSWITAATGSGNGAINYTVAPNTTMSSRSATINIGGQIFTINQAGFNPTAANAAIAGRILTANGRGANGVTLELIGDGQIKRARTNAFGYYRFADVPVGQSYVITAHGKRYVFAPEMQSINLFENAENVNFTAVNQ